MGSRTFQLDNVSKVRLAFDSKPGDFGGENHEGEILSKW